MSDAAREKAEAHWKWLAGYLSALRGAGLFRLWAIIGDEEFEKGLAAEGERYIGTAIHFFGHGYEERGAEDAKRE